MMPQQGTGASNSGNAFPEQPIGANDNVPLVDARVKLPSSGPGAEVAIFDHRLAAQTLNALHAQRGDFVCDLNADGPKFYALGMFPYPSGNAHMGHVLVYSITDVRARQAKLDGSNVLNPLGWDAFGLPAENAAIKNNADPAEWTALNIDRMKNEQFVGMGWSFDPSKEINTASPLYYANTQRLFLLMLERGLAYRGDGLVNWDPVDQTVLANEQVIDGKSWRSGAPVEKRYMKQWFFSVSPYSERLWSDLDKLDGWPGSALAVQRNWIKRMEGAEVNFAIANSSEVINVFTTRVDTIFGVSAIVLAPEHPIVRRLSEDPSKPQIREYVDAALKKDSVARLSDTERIGIPTGLEAIHPLTGEMIPVWISDYVLGDVGTGGLMCVPAHDERDHDFAKRYDLAAPVVIAPEGEVPKGPFTNDGLLIDSGKFTGLTSAEARLQIVEALVELGLGKSNVVYNLRDWSVGRQRYWGAPIPIVHCDSCGPVPVPDEQLPVLLPPPKTTEGKPSLAHDPDFVNTTCPCCGQAATRETDTLDTFVCSSWYAYRFLDPNNTSAMFDAAPIGQWMPLDFYVGGLEHAAQHMIYFRFITKVLHDAGLVAADEPVSTFFCNGMIRKDGAKMSKSKGNVVVPTEVVEQYGGDALRMYVLSDTPADQDREWDDRGIEAKSRFVSRCYQHLMQFLNRSAEYRGSPVDLSALDASFIGNFYRAGEVLRDSVKQSQFHNGVARVHELSSLLFGELSRHSTLDPQRGAALRQVARDYLVMVSPFMPYMSETVLNAHFDSPNGIYNERWPEVDAKLIVQQHEEVVIQINGKRKAVVQSPIGADEAAVRVLAEMDPQVNTGLAGKQIRKVIFRQGNVLNYVVA